VILNKFAHGELIKYLNSDEQFEKPERKMRGEKERGPKIIHAIQTILDRT